MEMRQIGRKTRRALHNLCGQKQHNLGQSLRAISPVLCFNISFNFEIVNFLFLDGDVPRSPSYGVYISQLIRFMRV